MTRRYLTAKRLPAYLLKSLKKGDPQPFSNWINMYSVGYLDCSNCFKGLPKAALLAATVIGQSEVLKLDLSGNNLGPYSIDIAKALTSPQSKLLKLNFSANSLLHHSPQFAQIVSQKNSPIREIDISTNGLQDTEYTQVVKYISSPESKIYRVNLEFNLESLTTQQQAFANNPDSSIFTTCPPRLLSDQIKGENFLNYLKKNPTHYELMKIFETTNLLPPLEHVKNALTSSYKQQTSLSPSNINLVNVALKENSSGLNSTQKALLDATLQFMIDEILSLKAELSCKIFKLLYKVTELPIHNIKNSAEFNELQRINQEQDLGGIAQLLEIFTHSHPQNRSTGSPYIGVEDQPPGFVTWFDTQNNIRTEEQGLLSLSTHDDPAKSSKCTRQDVVDYIAQQLRQQRHDIKLEDFCSTAKTDKVKKYLGSGKVSGDKVIETFAKLIAEKDQQINTLTHKLSKDNSKTTLCRTFKAKVERLKTKVRRSEKGSKRYTSKPTAKSKVTLTQN